MYCSEVCCNKSVGIKQVEELIEKPGGAVIDEPDEVVDVIEVERTGPTWKTYRMVDNITCLSPQLQCVPKCAFWESNTVENLFERQ